MLSQKKQLILIAGLPASGKTWFAKALAEKLNALHINSDLVRGELKLRGKYDPKTKQRVYDTMLDKASESLANGLNTIVDSTFFKKELRKPWMALGNRTGAIVHFFEMWIPENISKERLKKKRLDSEADWEVYCKLKAEWEDLEEKHLRLNSHLHTTDELLKIAQDYLSKES